MLKTNEAYHCMIHFSDEIIKDYSSINTRLTNEQIKEKLKTNTIVKSFIELFKGNEFLFSNNIRLVGGAVIDIIEDRIPKDYDFFGWNSKSIKCFESNGYKFISDTRTAITYRKGSVIVQLLKTMPSDFEFTISQACFAMNGYELKLDRVSYENKSLIPCNWSSRAGLLDGLRRLPHWKRKGYSISDITYLSMLARFGKNESEGGIDFSS